MRLDYRRAVSRLVTFVGVCTLGLTAVAQNPQAPRAPTAQTPQPAGQRGRGRGRVIQSMALTTTAWTDGGLMPDRYTQKGHDVSPPLAWTNAPDPTTSFVLIVHDLDTPIAPGTDDLLQWMLWNIPGTAHALAEGVKQGPELADGTRQISATGPYYRGPAATPNGPAHHCVFELFALDTMIDVPAVGASPPATRSAVVAAMAGHVVGKGLLLATAKR